MKKLHLFFAVLLLACNYQVLAQGCSDAGFCTMGSLKPDQKFNKKTVIKLRSVEISQYYGLTHFKDHIIATNIDFNVGLSAKSTLQFKMPYQIVSGPLANTHGIGDISVSFTRSLVSKENLQISATIGAKIPTNNSNITTQRNNVELPLPMYYQTSLGTYDLVFGASLVTKKWLLGVGLQQVIINDNQNTFLWGAWRTNAPEMRSLSDPYPVSKNLARGTDIMLRVERNFRFSNYNFNVGLLPIYRINRDFLTSFDPIARTEVRGEADKTEGLALSALFGGGYNFSVKSGIKLMFGYNVLDFLNKTGVLEKRYRINPDGLSRDLVTTIGYEFRF